MAKPRKFGLEDSVKEGFYSLNEGDWIKVYLDNSNWVYGEVINIGIDGVRLNSSGFNPATGKLELRESYLCYKSLGGFRKVTKDEAEDYIKNEPSLSRYHKDALTFLSTIKSLTSTSKEELERIVKEGNLRLEKENKEETKEKE